MTSATPLSISHIAPGSPWWIYAIVIAGLTLHIGGAIVGILSGAATVTVAKGERLHRLFGTIFVLAMLTMATAAIALALPLHQMNNAAGGMFVFYLIGTSWAAAHWRDGRARRFERIGLAAVLAISGLFATWGVMASAQGRLFGYPPYLYYMIAGIAALFAAVDLKVVLQGGLTEVQRVARHLWRMSFAFFVATGSFFIGQQKVMPKFVHGSPVLIVLGVAPLAVMAFWLVRVRIGKRFKGAAAAVT